MIGVWVKVLGLSLSYRSMLTDKEWVKHINANDIVLFMIRDVFDPHVRADIKNTQKYKEFYFKLCIWNCFTIRTSRRSIQLELLKIHQPIESISRECSCLPTFHTYLRHVPELYDFLSRRKVLILSVFEIT